jgi:hypothetical protein
MNLALSYLVPLKEIKLESFEIYEHLWKTVLDQK